MPPKKAAKKAGAKKAGGKARAKSKAGSKAPKDDDDDSSPKKRASTGIRWHKADQDPGRPWSQDHPDRLAALPVLKIHTCAMAREQADDRKEALQKVLSLALKTERNKVQIWKDDDVRPALLDSAMMGDTEWQEKFGHVKPPPPTPRPLAETMVAVQSITKDVGKKMKALKAMGNTAEEANASVVDEADDAEPVSQEDEVAIRSLALCILLNLAVAHENKVQMWATRRCRDAVLRCMSLEGEEYGGLVVHAFCLVRNISSCPTLQGTIWDDESVRDATLRGLTLKEPDDIHVRVKAFAILKNVSNNPKAKAEMWKHPDVRERVLDCAEEVPSRSTLLMIDLANQELKQRAEKLRLSDTARETRISVMSMEEDDELLKSYELKQAKTELDIWLKAVAILCNLASADVNKVSLWNEPRVREALAFVLDAPESFLKDCRAHALGALKQLSSEDANRIGLWEEPRVRNSLLQALAQSRGGELDNGLKAVGTLSKMSTNEQIQAAMWQEEELRQLLCSLAAQRELGLTLRGMVMTVLQNLSAGRSNIVAMWKDTQLRDALLSECIFDEFRQDDPALLLRKLQKRPHGLLSKAVDTMVNLMVAKDNLETMWAESRLRQFFCSLAEPGTIGDGVRSALLMEETPGSSAMRVRVASAMMCLSNARPNRVSMWLHNKTRSFLVEHARPGEDELKEVASRGYTVSISSAAGLKVPKRSEVFCKCEILGPSEQKLQTRACKEAPQNPIWDVTQDIDPLSFGDVLLFNVYSRACEELDSDSDDSDILPPNDFVSGEDSNERPDPWTLERRPALMHGENIQLAEQMEQDSKKQKGQLDCWLGSVVVSSSMIFPLGLGNETSDAELKLSRNDEEEEHGHLHVAVLVPDTVIKSWTKFLQHSKRYKVQVTVVGAKELCNSDIDGQSDPYCVGWIVGNESTRFRTPMLEATLEPQWNYVHVFENVGQADALEFNIYDYDADEESAIDRARGNDHMGCVVVTGRELLQGQLTGRRDYPVLKGVGHTQHAFASLTLEFELLETVGAEDDERTLTDEETDGYSSRMERHLHSADGTNAASPLLAEEPEASSDLEFADPTKRVQATAETEAEKPAKESAMKARMKKHFARNALVETAQHQREGRSQPPGFATRSRVRRNAAEDQEPPEPAEEPEKQEPITLLKAALIASKPTTKKGTAAPEKPAVAKPRPSHLPGGYKYGSRKAVLQIEHSVDEPYRPAHWPVPTEAPWKKSYVKNGATAEEMVALGPVDELTKLMAEPPTVKITLVSAKGLPKPEGMEREETKIAIAPLWNQEEEARYFRPTDTLILTIHEEDLEDAAATPKVAKKEVSHSKTTVDTKSDAGSSKESPRQLRPPGPLARARLHGRLLLEALPDSLGEIELPLEPAGSGTLLVRVGSPMGGDWPRLKEDAKERKKYIESLLPKQAEYVQNCKLYSLRALLNLSSEKDNLVHMTSDKKFMDTLVQNASAPRVPPERRYLALEVAMRMVSRPEFRLHVWQTRTLRNALLMSAEPCCVDERRRALGLEALSYWVADDSTRKKVWDNRYARQLIYDICAVYLEDEEIRRVGLDCLSLFVADEKLRQLVWQDTDARDLFVSFFYDGTEDDADVYGLEAYTHFASHDDIRAEMWADQQTREVILLAAAGRLEDIPEEGRLLAIEALMCFVNDPEMRTLVWTDDLARDVALDIAFSSQQVAGQDIQVNGLHTVAAFATVPAQQVTMWHNPDLYNGLMRVGLQWDKPEVQIFAFAVWASIATHSEVVLGMWNSGVRHVLSEALVTQEPQFHRIRAASFTIIKRMSDFMHLRMPIWYDVTLREGILCVASLQVPPSSRQERFDALRILENISLHSGSQESLWREPRFVVAMIKASGTSQVPEETAMRKVAVNCWRTVVEQGSNKEHLQVEVWNHSSVRNCILNLASDFRPEEMPVRELAICTLMHMSHASLNKVPMWRDDATREMLILAAECHDPGAEGLRGYAVQALRSFCVAQALKFYVWKDVRSRDALLAAARRSEDYLTVEHSRKLSPKVRKAISKVYRDIEDPAINLEAQRMKSPGRSNRSRLSSPSEAKATFSPVGRYFRDEDEASRSTTPMSGTFPILENDEYEYEHEQVKLPLYSKLEPIGRQSTNGARRPSWQPKTSPIRIRGSSSGLVAEGRG
eukprot:TRINITY_DN36961_c0_g1_i1.p1 TRINITY_DN36961_c0_g1~~TRINITY_DN36961_c0_g1_i1.p1  ORF type:complete len:2154 (-),score=540.59 TRINITY_DN36961_c0_g1_i1:275-6736(-)